MSDRADQAIARASPDISIRSSSVVMRATPCWRRRSRRLDFIRKRTLWRCIRVPPLVVHAEITRVDYHRGALDEIVALVKSVLERWVRGAFAASNHRDAHRANRSPVIRVAGRSVRRLVGGVVAVAVGDGIIGAYLEADDSLGDNVRPGRCGPHQLRIRRIAG